jgi:formylmethanofuran dehydrogenase subunit E
MAFLKRGSPQPIRIASGVCEECHERSATTLLNGKMICNVCKDKMASSKEEK